MPGRLLLTCLYAACAHGAVASSDEERVQLVIASIAAVAAAARLWSGTLRFRAPPVVWAGVALLAAFACWSGVTLLWSVAPTISVHQGDLTRARAYLLDAVRRAPTDGPAWQELAFEDFDLRDDADALAAERRALALDPRGVVATTLAQRAMLSLTPPAGSATVAATAPARSAR